MPASFSMIRLPRRISRQVDDFVVDRELPTSGRVELEGSQRPNPRAAWCPPGSTRSGSLPLFRDPQLSIQLVPASSFGCQRDGPLLAELVGFGILALEDQAADLRQGLERLWVVTVLGSARPERVLVEADPLGPHTAVNHAAQAAVAYRHRLEPFSGWPRIPKAQKLVRRIRPTGENRIGGLNPSRQQQ